MELGLITFADMQPGNPFEGHIWKKISAPQDFPANTIVRGIPAKFIKNI